MTPAALTEHHWQAVIDAHPLESHDPDEWLRYGVALLQTITPQGQVVHQQQQAALAFLQAMNEQATAEQITAAQHHSALLSLRDALRIAEIPIPEHLLQALRTPD